MGGTAAPAGGISSKLRGGILIKPNGWISVLVVLAAVGAAVVYKAQDGGIEAFFHTGDSVYIVVALLALLLLYAATTWRSRLGEREKQQKK